MGGNKSGYVLAVATFGGVAVEDLFDAFRTGLDVEILHSVNGLALGP